jgi:hypothetical protein
MLELSESCWICVRVSVRCSSIVASLFTPNHSGDGTHNPESLMKSRNAIRLCLFIEG